MKIQTKKEENTLIVSLDGKIDGATAPELEAELIGWLDQGETALDSGFTGGFLCQQRGVAGRFIGRQAAPVRRPTGHGRSAAGGEGNL